MKNKKNVQNTQNKCINERKETKNELNLRNVKIEKDLTDLLHQWFAGVNTIFTSELESFLSSSIQIFIYSDIFGKTSFNIYWRKRGYIHYKLGNPALPRVLLVKVNPLNLEFLNQARNISMLDHVRKITTLYIYWAISTFNCGSICEQRLFV